MGQRDTEEVVVEEDQQEEDILVWSPPLRNQIKIKLKINFTFLKKLVDP